MNAGGSSLYEIFALLTLIGAPARDMLAVPSRIKKLFREVRKSCEHPLLFLGHKPVEVHVEGNGIIAWFHLRKREPLLPVPVDSTGFGINRDDPAAGELRDMQHNDKNPEKHDGPDSVALEIAVTCHPGDLDGGIFAVFP